MVNMAQKIAGGAKTAGVATLNVAKKVATHKATKIAAIVLLCSTVVGGIAFGTYKLVKHIQAKRQYAAEEKTLVGRIRHRAQATRDFVSEKAAAAKNQAAKAAGRATTFAKDHRAALAVGAVATAVTAGCLVSKDTFGVNDTVADAATSGWDAACSYISG